MTASRPLCIAIFRTWVGLAPVVITGLCAAQPPPQARPGVRKPAAAEDAPPPGDRPWPSPGRRMTAGEDGPARPWAQWSEAQRRQVEKFIEENFPRMYLELQRLKDRNPVRYGVRMTRVAPHMRRIMETMRTYPELGELMIRERQIEMEIWQTVASYRQADDDQTKERLRGQLRELAARAFDCRHERRKLEVAELESRLAMLQNRLSEADKMRDELIDRRVTELLERFRPAERMEDDGGEPGEKTDGAGPPPDQE